MGTVRSRILRSLCRRTHGIESDVGEEHDSRACHDTIPAILARTLGWWDEGMPIGAVDRMRRCNNKEDDDRTLDEHDHIVDVGRFLDADDEQGRDDGDDDGGRQVEDRRHLRSIVQATSVPRAAEMAQGKLMPTSCRNDTTYPDQPIATVTAPSAYSSTRSHPIIQAISSPSVAYP